MATSQRIYVYTAYLRLVRVLLMSSEPWSFLTSRSKSLYMAMRMQWDNWSAELHLPSTFGFFSSKECKPNSWHSPHLIPWQWAPNKGVSSHWAKLASSRNLYSNIMASVKQKTNMYYNSAASWKATCLTNTAILGLPCKAQSATEIIGVGYYSTGDAVEHHKVGPKLPWSWATIKCQCQTKDCL